MFEETLRYQLRGECQLTHSILAHPLLWRNRTELGRNRAGTDNPLPEFVFHLGFLGARCLCEWFLKSFGSSLGKCHVLSITAWSWEHHPLGDTEPSFAAACKSSRLPISSCLWVAVWELQPPHSGAKVQSQNGGGRRGPSSQQTQPV